MEVFKYAYYVKDLLVKKFTFLEIHICEKIIETVCIIMVTDLVIITNLFYQQINIFLNILH